MASCEMIYAEIVSIIFGLFFVFSEKQIPGLKMRNFKKTMNKSVKPIRVVRDRLSVACSGKCEVRTSC